MFLPAVVSALNSGLPIQNPKTSSSGGEEGHTTVNNANHEEHSSSCVSPTNENTQEPAQKKVYRGARDACALQV